MRVLIAAAVFAFGSAGAHAADLDYSRGYSDGYSGPGYRGAQVVIYDYQPGVLVRAYWRAPWRHRHYYPTTGEKPEVGRDEDLTAASNVSAPSETFQRYWSTCFACLIERPPAGARDRDAAPDPRDEQFPQPPLRGK